MDFGRLAAMLERRGQAMTLRRPGSPDIDVTLKAARIGASSQQAVQGQTVSTFKVRLSNKEIAAQASYTLPILPQSDVIVDADGRSYVIEAVDTKRPGGVVVAHVLTVTG